MPAPAVAALATDPPAKVLVFIDGQNLYKTCRSLFGHSLCHPHLLARHLAGPRTRAVLELGGRLTDMKIAETEGRTCGGRCTGTGTSTPANGYGCPLMMSRSRAARDSSITSCISRAPR